MSQLSLLPIQLVDEQPADRQESRDLLWIGLDEQSRRYALKTVEPANPYLPLTEWLCYHLCGLAGIITPEFAVVIRIDGSKAFGSRWAEGALQFSPAKISQPQMESWLQRSQSDVGSMFALDAFMPNQDRHLGNILFQTIGNRFRALAFDWSRTLIFSPWPWPADSKSASVWAWLSMSNLADLAAVDLRFQRIKQISAGDVYKILDAAPIEWRDNMNIDAAAKWWQEHRESRSEDAGKLLQVK